MCASRALTARSPGRQRSKRRGLAMRWAFGSINASRTDNNAPSSRLALLCAVAFGAVLGAFGRDLLAHQIQNEQPAAVALSQRHRLQDGSHRVDSMHHSSAAVGNQRRRLQEASHRADGKHHSFNHGIHSLMREWGCGHHNMEAPKLLPRGGGGIGATAASNEREVLVDIGLGLDAMETATAVLNGFIVIAFEPMPENMHAVQKALNRHVNSGTAKTVNYIEMERGADGNWTMPPLAKPAAGHGHAYVIRAAVGDVDGTVMLPKAGTDGVLGSIASANATASLQLNAIAAVPTPQVKLDTVMQGLPWVTHVRLLKIDTQGFELKVLRGAMDSLKAGLFTYVQYEFSPWLMQRGALGDPLQLLQLLPRLDAMCFDMMGDHNLFPRPGHPLESYYEHLNSAKHSVKTLRGRGNISVNGPWEDILCYFPWSSGRVAPLIERPWGGSTRWPSKDMCE